MTTERPTQLASTPSPTASTIPAPSEPRIVGEANPGVLPLADPDVAMIQGGRLQPDHGLARAGPGRARLRGGVLRRARPRGERRLSSAVILLTGTVIRAF